MGRALYDDDKEKLKAWLKPLVRQLKNESAIKVIRPLDEALAGLPAGPAGGRTDRQRPGGSDLSARPVSVQAAGAIQEPDRRRSPPVSGNLLAQRALVTPLPPPRLRPCKKLRCARWLVGTGFRLASRLEFRELGHIVRVSGHFRFWDKPHLLAAYPRRLPKLNRTTPPFLRFTVRGTQTMQAP